MALADPSGGVAESARESGSATFYRYRDAQGRLVIVDSLSRVPSGARASVESVVLAAPKASVARLTETWARELHGPSFIAGAACALLLTLAWLGLRRLKAPLLRWSLLGGLVLLGASAYFGWVRRMGGRSDALVATPAALIEDAKSAVEQMNARSREQQRLLQELESQR